MRPTMSYTALFLACQWPWGREDVPRIGQNAYMRYGSAFHEVMAHRLIELRQRGASNKPPAAFFAKLAKKFDVEAQELVEHTTAAFDVIRAWIQGGEKAGNPWGQDVFKTSRSVVIEEAVAYDIEDDSARSIAVSDENHVYQDASESDLPGTVDLGVEAPFGRPEVAFILDHKSGMDCDPPAESPQHRSLALAHARRWKAKRGIVATLHAPRDGLPVVYSDELTDADLASHARDLRRAHGRIGDGSLTPGDWCARCPAAAVCPVFGRNLLALAPVSKDPLVEAARERIRTRDGIRLPILSLDTPEGVGDAHDILATYDHIAEAIRAKMRESIRTNGPGVKRNGKLLVLASSSRENLSKSSVLKAYGQAKGEAMLEKLRKDGAIVASEREEMRVVNDSGG